MYSPLGVGGWQTAAQCCAECTFFPKVNDIGLKPDLNGKPDPRAKARGNGCPPSKISSIMVPHLPAKLHPGLHPPPFHKRLQHIHRQSLLLCAPAHIQHQFIPP